MPGSNRWDRAWEEMGKQFTTGRDEAFAKFWEEPMVHSRGTEAPREAESVFDRDSTLESRLEAAESRDDFDREDRGMDMDRD